MSTESMADGQTSIAIVGMACRFPGARDIDQYWCNVRDGVESITHFADGELVAAGVKAEAITDPSYVKAGPVLEGIELFDAGFFGFTPAEARICDPQQRLFLEVAWTALESANCDPSRFAGAIGVFAGSALSTYLLNNLVPNRGLAEWASPMQIALGNDKDSLSTRVAYAFGLRGPCYGVQSYCSSSLVAVATACTSLVAGECDAALAGGVAISVPQDVGYYYQQGGIASPDGRCRAFDAAAQGAPLGNGVGVVVLKRLADAVAEGDHVRAVIRGWAVNNDGDLKVGYTAPSVRGQAEVISDALANADVEGAQIDYVEAHGTGTALGDAVEFAAMVRAFGEVPVAGSCAVGSVKTNFGHLDRAAGVAGLIKTVLALEHRKLPPILHFRTPNPQIDFAGSPFRVQTELADWPHRGHPRLAGVSAFGIGGTNAHVVLQEAPPVPPVAGSARPQLLVLSARTPAAIDARVRELADALDRDLDLDLADVAYTLHGGRKEFEHRCAMVVADRDDAVKVLRNPGSDRLLCGADPVPGRRIGLVFAGAGEWSAELTAELYQSEQAFQQAVDECAAVLGSLLGRDVREVFGHDGTEVPSSKELTSEFADAALFVVEYGLARLLMQCGVTPDAVAGHGVGEYVAAVVAQVLVLPEVLALLAFRARLTDGTPKVAMAELTGWVREHLTPSAPRVPYLSTVTGTWIRTSEATDPGYWARALGSGVAGTDQLTALLAEPDRMVIEIGPGQTMLRSPGLDGASRVVPVLPGQPATSAAQAVQTALARLWLAGVSLDWHAYHQGQQRRRVPLPSYPFQWQRYWVDPPPTGAPEPHPPAAEPAASPQLYVPAWRPGDAVDAGTPTGPFLLFIDWPSGATPPGPDLGAALAARLAGHAPCVRVSPGTGFAELAEDAFIVRPDELADYDRLVGRLAASGRLPATVVHAWAVTGPDTDPAHPDTVRRHRIRGFNSLSCLARSLSGHASRAVRITVVADYLHDADRSGLVSPGKASLLGTCLVIPQEHPGFTCRSVDIDTRRGADVTATADRLIRELAAPEPFAVAYRGSTRLVQSYLPTSAPAGETVLRNDGVYLITGGLGNVGMLLARHLAATVRESKLVLLGRRGLPPREQWAELAEADPGSEVGTRVRRLLAIEELGAQVLVVAAEGEGEGGERAGVEHAVRQALRRFGMINGVVHAAGCTAAEDFAPIQTLSGAQIERHFTAKVDSLLAVERALAGQPVDFYVLFSSMSTVLGGLGFAAYTAANAVLDGFAALWARSGTRWISVDWDTWRLSGDQLGAPGLGSSMTEYAMTIPEGLDAFDRVLATGVPRVIVSAGELATRLRQWVNGVFADPVDGPAPDLFPRPDLAEAYVPATSEYERRLAGLWREILGIEQVGVNDNFFDLGGNSLMGLQLLKRIGQGFGTNVPAVALFQAPTINALARYLAPPADQPAQSPATVELVRRRQAARRSSRADTVEMAIIGMAGRFPGASDVDQFWRNLREGKETIRFFTDEELIAEGVSAQQVRAPNYVKARPVLDGIDLFDAGFFGYSPREATLTDPQQRVFLECCWHALENAGYAGSFYQGLVGVFAGTNISTYLRRLHETGNLDDGVNDYQVVIGNDKDSLTTAVSYKLNLTGPSMAVQSFCSTSLLAVHLAAQSLRAAECDIALAGGVSIRVPDRVGHLYLEGGMESPDGHVRTFDARARGSMFGDGVGVVVLKRLADAVADGDTVCAVIKGSAVNNDGSLKVGFTAPSVVGQAEVVALALADAGVRPESLSYLEAHGTATELGDPIEVAALSKAFGATAGTQYCAIGSVKTNVGHLDRAAGISGLIKVVLALRHREIPPSLHFTEPNPEIDFVNSPFYVNTRCTRWTPPPGVPRRAGVNSLGMGGTNVHVVVEEAPAREPAAPARAQQLLVLSARTAAALEDSTAELARYLRENPGAELADVAYTLQVGRASFQHRRLVRCSSVAEAVKALEGGDPARVLTRDEPHTNRPVGLLFAGVGEHYPGMAADLYGTEPAFRSAVDECCAVLDPLLSLDLRQVLFGGGSAPAGPDSHLPALLGRGAASPPSAADELLNRTMIAQPAVFTVEYALARLLMSWGCRPAAMAGYSLGEYVAATLAGVLTVSDALRLVAHRARLIDALPGGAMLAVPLPADRVRPLLDGGVQVAAVNAPDQCVLAGPSDAVLRLAERLAERDIVSRRLDTTHAFHSTMLAPVAAELTGWVRGNVTLSPAQLPYVSNVTGTWMTAEDATDAGYWARHMCGAVQFADDVGTLLADPDRMLVEIGPGQSLGTFVRRHSECSPARMALVIPTLPARHERITASEAVHAAQGKLWLAAASTDWDAYHAGERRHRVPLPGYPFQRERYWMDQPQPAGSARAPRSAVDPAADLTGSPREILTALPRQELDHWFSLPAWHQTAPPTPAAPPAEGTWLVFADAEGVADAVVARLGEVGGRVVRVVVGVGFRAIDEDVYTVRANEPEDYATLLEQVQPRYVLHLWLLDQPSGSWLDDGGERTLECGYFSLLWLAQALGRTGTSCDLIVAAAGTCNVTGTDEVRPERAVVTGPCKVIPLELARVTCRQVDVGQPASAEQAAAVAGQLLSELSADPSQTQVAWRGSRRWLPRFEPLPVRWSGDDSDALRERGVYLITGGLGGIGLSIARGLARTVSARLVLVGRAELPPPAQWPALHADPRTPAELRQRIEAVGDLRSAGAEVLVCAADVADSRALRNAITAAVDRFGCVHGVVHTAGVPGMGLLQFKNHDNAAVALRPKFTGTRFLLDCLAGLELDFLALFSSITAITGGGPGQVDYCSANAYLDAVAQRAAVLGGPRVISINWAEWRWNAWGAGLSGYSPEAQQFFADNRSRVGISFEEGWQAFLTALASNEPQLIVSPQDFRVLAELSRTFTIETVLSLGLEARGRHHRPELGTSYVAPGTEQERRIAAIWSEALGLTDIGVHDNFFELGGNSLLGVDVVARIRRDLNQDRLAPHVLYLAPTVCALAEFVDGIDHGARGDDRRERGALRRQSVHTRRKR